MSNCDIAGGISDFGVKVAIGLASEGEMESERVKRPDHVGDADPGVSSSF